MRLGSRVAVAGALTAAVGVSAIALAVAGCGSTRGPALVDRLHPPFINALAIDPKDRSLLLATNRGIFHIGADGRHYRLVHSSARAAGAAGPYGRRVSAFAFLGPGRLIGSGHPDVAGRLPAFLGVMTSSDGGGHWTGLARVGLSDLHVIDVADGNVYGYDTTLGAAIVSADGGRTFSERSAPAAAVLDIAVDPGDGRYLLAATARSLARSTDQGRSWQTIAAARQARLAWAGPELVRADGDGRVARSGDRGRAWTAIGRLSGSPGKLVALAGTLYAALLDGTVQVSTDGGRRWRTLFAP